VLETRLRRELMDRAKIVDRQPEVVEFAKGLKKEGYEKVSLLGYCWGKLFLAFFKY
jgi:dienelactone hydrolase